MRLHLYEGPFLVTSMHTKLSQATSSMLVHRCNSISVTLEVRDNIFLAFASQRLEA
jgi:hypothetical protein